MKKSMIAFAIAAVVACVPTFAAQNPPAGSDTTKTTKASKPKKVKKHNKKAPKKDTTAPVQK